MARFRFLHAADLHVDSPLHGLAVYEGAPTEQLRGATRAAMRNLVRIAVDLKVDFVVVAGDLFDGQWPDMQTGLWTAGQFRELARQSIPVYLIRGNHDAESKVRKAITWPDNVQEFSSDVPETKLLETLRVALHGQGFGQPRCTIDLAEQYPRAVPGYFNLGILHTSLTGSETHGTYAPTRPDVLRAKGYDYWALGHVHQVDPRSPVSSDRPYIAYSGNTQGRSVRETGAKGCLIVDVEDGELVSVEFQPTDVVRWHVVHVPLDPADTRVELLERVRDRLGECRSDDEGRLSAVRVILSGRTAAHADLARRATRDLILAEIRNAANDLGDAWVEKIIDDTEPPGLRGTLGNPSSDTRREEPHTGADLLGDLQRDIDSLRDDEDGLRTLARELAPLLERQAEEIAGAGLQVDDPEQLRGWLRHARQLLVTHLVDCET